MSSSIPFLKRPIEVACIVVIMLLTTTVTNAQTSPKRSLLALSKANHTLAIVDPASLQIVGRIPVGEDPHEVVASADGKTAYICIYGGGSLHEINLVDLITQKPLVNIDTRPLYGPHDITFVKDKAWFTAEGSKSIGRYDPATNKVDWSMGTGQDRTHMIYVSADAKKIYTTNVASGTVSILVAGMSQPGRMPPPNGQPPAGMAPPNKPPRPPGNPTPREDWSQTIITTAKGSEGFDVSPDERELWTASSEDGSISIIDLAAKKLAIKFDARVQGANRVKFTPTGKQVFITSLQTGELTIFDAKTRKEVKRLKVGSGAAGILMDPISSRAFIACSADNYIAIVDLTTLEVTSRLDVGGVPDGLAWAIRPE